MLLPTFTPAVLAADSDTVSWSASPAVGSFGDPSATSTTYTTPDAPTCDITPMATLAKIDVTGTVKDKVLTAVITETMAKDALVAEKDTGEGIAIQFNVTGYEDYVSLSATLGRKAMETFRAADVKYVQIASAVIDLFLDLEAITEILDQTTGNIIISSIFQDKLSDEAELLIGSRPVFDITTKDCKGAIVSDLKDGIITIGITYKLKIDEKSGNLYGVYMDSKGKPQPLTNSTYDNGMVIFGINIPSTYGVGYQKTIPVFTDIISHWAKDDIDFIAGREIFTSTNTTAFSPDTPITRAMFVTALGRLSDAEISGDTTGSFSDIPADSYYLPYVE